VEGQVVDGEVVEETTSTEVVVAEKPQQSGQVTLFGTSDPAEVIVRAAKVADALKDILKKQGLTSRISGKDHVNVEGWQTLGTMVGVFPVKEWVEELPWPDPVPEAVRGQKEKGLAFGFKASFRAQTLSGAVVGGAEAECKRTEGKPWTWGADFALKSMAQTRATSKCLSTPLRFIITMAGYSGTPAEEMSYDEQPRTDHPPQKPFGAAIVKEQAESLARALVFLTGSHEDANNVYRSIEGDAGYMPLIAARAILHTARTVRDKQNNEENNTSE
jgi:hypothetical protein